MANPPDPTNPAGESADSDDAMDQSAIDALMGGGDAPEESSASADAPAEEASDAGEMDQSAIDALMGGGDASDTPAAEESSGVAEISQADIDALLGGDGGAGDAASPADPPEVDERLDSLGRPFDAAAAEMQAAIEAEKAEAAEKAAAAAPSTASVSLPELSPPAGVGGDTQSVSMLNDVNLRVKIELGRTRMLVEDVLQLGNGSVVELDKLAGDPVDVYANERLIARGEVLILNDNFCVRISEVLSHDPHRVSA